jgi:hypothetical protein
MGIGYAAEKGYWVRVRANSYPLLVEGGTSAPILIWPLVTVMLLLHDHTLVYDELMFTPGPTLTTIAPPISSKRWNPMRHVLWPTELPSASGGVEETSN